MDEEEYMKQMDELEGNKMSGFQRTKKYISKIWLTERVWKTPIYAANMSRQKA